MKRIGHFFYRVFFWTYNRGTWQWDLMCLFLLMIIFGTNRNFLEKYSAHPMTSSQIYSQILDYLKSIF